MKRMTANFRAQQMAVILGITLLLSSSSAGIAAPQQTGTTNFELSPPAAQVPGVPRLVRFDGTLKPDDGNIPTGKITISFSLYQDQQGGNPLWTQTGLVNVSPDGHYSVLLGATDPGGLPGDLFNDDKPRWVGVLPNAPGFQGELPRVLLLGVPYALKAADSETLGGKPASDYVTTEALRILTQRASQPRPASLAVAPALTAALAGTGTTNFLPIWANSTTLGNSTIFETGNNVGIGTTAPATTLDVNGGATVRGDLQFTAGGTATATAGSASHTENFLTSTFNSGTQTAVSQKFRWQAEPAGNNTAAPSATLNLLFGANNAAPAETGLSINSRGLIKFASGQTFPATAVGTITGVKAGTDLTGGGTTGTVTLNLDTTKVPQLNAANMFTGNQAIAGSLTVNVLLSAGTGTFGGTLTAANLSIPPTSGTNSGIIYFGGNPFIHAGGNANNTFLGMMAGNFTNQGFDNLGVGRLSLKSDTTGASNTAINYATLTSNTTGFSNIAIAPYAGLHNTTGSFNTYVGPSAGITNTTGSYDTFLGVSTNSADGLTNATAIGANAYVGTSNSVVLGSGANVGIGTSTPPYPLTVQADDNGSPRFTPHQFMIQGHSDPNKQLLVGYLADNAADNGYGALQATWAGHYNTALALNPNGGQVFVGTTSSFAGAPFIIGQGRGSALADGWTTYSSRRWKTDIQTLPDALAKVQRMRGVSYDLKENGKHEIGVIAEEVGQVLPEIVSWDKNGKDANGVDYTRLTAVLIEAVKQQQHEIEEQQTMLRTQAVAMRRLTAEITSARKSLHQLKAQFTDRQSAMLASR
ncbi:MAG TPA: tail fiber domain-containing protein [Bryobacteraceae bacterium]|jgi:hypothetical protein|nr:tail fiber domain-containing protein [Bryobacteraceae bacterium]